MNKTLEDIFQSLVDISCFWDKLGIFYGSLEAPWAPTPMSIVELVLDMVMVGPNDVLYDLGCGDGRVVIEAAKRGARAVCIEIDKKLIEMAKNNAQRQGVENNVVFVNDDFSRVSLSEATVIYMYLTTSVINRLKSKFAGEVRPGTAVISLDYELYWLEPVEILELYINERYYKVYLYIA